MAYMRILVCGGRNVIDRDYPAVKAVLKVIAREGDVIISGGAEGIDYFAHTFAISHDIESLQFMAEWNKDGKKAGPICNKRMLDEGKPDIVVAFKGGKGTASMVNLARKAKIPLLLAEYENGTEDIP